ncbi:testis-expressed protein 35 isoform X2 [Rhinolophus sinicus]|uniref:testis-expressed protein 35 isoform X2 n=1 Tax=Rhinolophus sinicus TaxID=89399 RepID=UPI003D7AA398
MQKDMEEKMDVLINIHKRSKLRGGKEHQEPRLTGKTDPRLRLKETDGVDRASLTLQKKTVPLQKPKTNLLGSLHQCETHCDPCDDIEPTWMTQGHLRILRPPPAPEGGRGQAQTSTTPEGSPDQSLRLNRFDCTHFHGNGLPTPFPKEGLP